MKETFLAWLVIIGVSISLYGIWFLVVPEIENDFWRGFATLGFGILSLFYLQCFGIAFYFDILKKERNKESIK